jgi:hypothetical protein
MCECTLYPLKRVANEQTVIALHPQVHLVLESEVDVESALDAAHDHVLLLLGSRGRARVFPGSNEFASATGLALLRNHYRHQAGPQAKELFERFSDELDREVEKLLQSIPPDDDQDGAIAEDEKRSFTSFRIYRA